jgi:hypothetical protein
VLLPASKLVDELPPSSEGIDELLSWLGMEMLE